VDWGRRSDTLATTIAGYQPLDLILWGNVKDKVFYKPVPDTTNLKARITGALATITEDLLENTWREVDYRLDVLRATKGAHIDVCSCVVNKLLKLHLEKKNYLYSTVILL
jgi:hypothetical protein